ncbi:MAG: hypothetical protein JW966_08585 [Anaerolineae bacterium]|nr:hypothetical protein [Anaerolineae bacterium]
MNQSAEQTVSRPISCLGRLIALGFGLVFALILVEIAGRVALGFEPLPRWAQDVNDRIGYELWPDTEYVYVSKSGEFENTVKTNSRGLHDVEHTLSKPDGVFRILILSDSYAQAREVPVEQNFARQLEQQLNDNAPGDTVYEVINAGQFGLGTTQEYLYYTNEGDRYDPDLVLVGFYVGNDVVDNHAPLIKAWNAVDSVDFPYFEPDGTLHQPGMATRRRVLSWLRHNSYLASTVSDAFGGTGQPDRVEVGDPGAITERALRVPMGVYLPPDAVWQAGWDVTAHALSELNAAVTQDGAALAVFVIPDRRQVYDTDWDATLARLPDLDVDTLDRERPTHTVLALLEHQAIPALNLLDLFRAADKRADERLYYATDGHFTPAGHTLTARALAEWLTSAGLLP